MLPVIEFNSSLYVASAEVFMKSILLFKIFAICSLFIEEVKQLHVLNKLKKVSEFFVSMDETKINSHKEVFMKNLVRKLLDVVFSSRKAEGATCS